MAGRFVPPKLADVHPASRNNVAGNTTSTTARAKRLPPGTVPSKLVGEGAANAVFEIQLPNGQTCPEIEGMNPGPLPCP